MKYDFSLARQTFAEKGWTLKEWAERANVNYTTLSKAMSRDSAHQTTAKAIARSLRIPFRALIVHSNGKKAA